MKRKFLFYLLGIIFILFFSLIVKTSLTGNVILEEKTKLGYCPTMQEDAKNFAKENGYELIKFDSSYEVLSALKNNKIDKAMIGRKAEKVEINSNTKETILKSGYTLVSNKKLFVDYSKLSLLEIYTSLEINFNFPVKKIFEEEVKEKINRGEIVLISWENWEDDFELVVVIEGNKKVKEFRGLFLYAN